MKGKREREVYIETLQTDLMSTALQVILKSTVNNDLLEIARPEAPWCINTLEIDSVTVGGEASCMKRKKYLGGERVFKIVRIAVCNSIHLLISF